MPPDSLHEFEHGLKAVWMRAQAGDETACRQALTMLADRLRGYFRRRLRQSPHDVEDLLQETLIVLHVQHGTYDPSLPVSAWAVAIARHELFDRWRRRGRREALHEPIDGVDEGLLAAADAQPGEVRRDLHRLLGALPPAQRRAIELTKLEGLRVEEAAARSARRRARSWPRPSSARCPATCSRRPSRG